jgi:metal-responsive CopG/Arc/MetJ family transcriptional regulator
MRARLSISLPEDLLRAIRIQAVRERTTPSRVIEKALRSYIGFGVLDEIWRWTRRQQLNEKESLDLAYEELRASREWRRRSSGR